MVENKSSLFGIIAIIIGASGLGLGVFSVVNFQTVEGDDGVDGEDAPGGLVVGILSLDDGETVSGDVTIKALIYGCENYNISVLRNSTQIGIVLPLTWDTTAISDGWWNITVIIIDTLMNNKSSDSVIVYVDNIYPNARVRVTSDYMLNDNINFPAEVDFDWETYDPENCFNLTTDRYIAQKEGYYLITAQVTMTLADGELLCLLIQGNTGEMARVFEPVGVGGIVSASITDIFYLNAGSWIALWVGHTAGVDRWLEGGLDRTFMTIAYIS